MVQISGSIIVFMVKSGSKESTETQLEREAVVVQEVSRDIVQVSGILEEKEISLAEKNFKGVEAHTDRLITQLEASYEETRRDARIWSVTSVAAAGLGLGMILSALVGWVLRLAEVTAVTGVLGAISGAISALFFRNWKLASARLASMVRGLEGVRKLDYAQRIAQSMDTPEARDHAKTIIVKGILENLSLIKTE